MLKNHTEDERIIFLDGKRKGKTQLNVATKPKKTPSLEPEIIHVGSNSDLENEEDAKDEEGVNASIYHTSNKFHATVVPFNKTESNAFFPYRTSQEAPGPQGI